MSYIFIDKQLPCAEKLKDLCRKYELTCSEEAIDDCIYFGFKENRPTAIFVKSFLFIGSSGNVNNLKLNDYLLPLDISDFFLDQQVLRCVDVFMQVEEIKKELSIAVHDLQGDLNHVYGYAQLLDIKLIDKESKDELAIIISSGKRLIDMIEGLRKIGLKHIF